MTALGNIKFTNMGLNNEITAKLLHILNLFSRNLRAIDLIRNVYRENGFLGFYKGT
jgi:hypothetical protein